MKAMKRGLAVLLAALLMIPSQPVSAKEAAPPAVQAVDEIVVNTGEYAYTVADISEDSESEPCDAYFEEDGSHTINIMEENPFFPYEVQFSCNGETTTEWFMTPEDSVEVGGHTFYVSAYFDGTAVTQMSLNVAGDTVIVYPEKKEFTTAVTGGAIVPFSLLPLTEKSLTVDLSGYTPAELTMVYFTSIFTGENALGSDDKIMWTYGAWAEDFTISTADESIDLSRYTYSNSPKKWTMIVGDADQLAAANIRYQIQIQATASEEWLLPTVYTQDEAGQRTGLTIEENEYGDYSADDRRWNITVPQDELGSATQAYLGLKINKDIFANTDIDSWKVYEGEFASATEAIAGKDITEQICPADMTQKDAGYLVEKYKYKDITLVTYDINGKVIGCLPFQLHLYISSSKGSISGFYSMYENTGSMTDIVYDYDQKYSDGCRLITETLYSEYAADGIYLLGLDYYQEGTSNNSLVTGAYIGQYRSIAEALAAGAEDIKSSLFTNIYPGGYAADYSKGIYFTIFVGADGDENQEIYKYCVKTETGTKSAYEEGLNNGTSVMFTGVCDSNGNRIDAYVVDYNEDSYAEYTYRTILVDASVDLSSLAPKFDTATGVNLYTEGSSTPEISGRNVHDFSKGAIQYTAAAENGSVSKNYWLQIVNATDEMKLYLNSLEDSDSNTRVENGVTYSTREVFLDSYHGYIHDIFLSNMSTENIPALKVELKSEVVELDDYWTLNGNYDLSGFTTTQTSTTHGELSNLAKIRLKQKDTIEAGTDVTGTLTIKSADTILMVLTLTGTIGNPCIITEEIPAAVKYVPYGTMIQNSNKYSWNEVSYELINGSLPGGMIVKENGEIYGVPTEAGEFTFTVEMKNSYSSFSSSRRTYTLVVAENTDENVDSATDQGYDLTERVQNVYLNSAGSQTLVSQGTYAEFVDIYLDGVKLVEGKDYTSEEGSTRVTLRSQTLKQSDVTGTHTLGMEFRTPDTDSLKRAAQNYTVIDDSGSDDTGNGGDDDTDNSTEDDTNSNNNGNGSSNEGDTSSDSTNNSNNSEDIANNVTNEKNDAVKESNTNSDKENATDINTSDNTTDSSTSENNGNDSSEVVTDITNNTNSVVYYIVQPGDSLWSIAVKYYGSGAYWKKILEDNKDTIQNPDTIFAGQQISIYLIPSDSIITAEAEKTDVSQYTIKSGDSLWKIAKEIYGKGWYWRKIYDANADIIVNPEHVYEGQVIRIPSN